jgi:hypothetical protein
MNSIQYLVQTSTNQSNTATQSSSNQSNSTQHRSVYLPKSYNNNYNTSNFTTAANLNTINPGPSLRGRTASPSSTQSRVRYASSTRPTLLSSNASNAASQIQPRYLNTTATTTTNAPSSSSKTLTYIYDPPAYRSANTTNQTSSINTYFSNNNGNGGGDGSVSGSSTKSNSIFNDGTRELTPPPASSQRQYLANQYLRKIEQYNTQQVIQRTPVKLLSSDNNINDKYKSLTKFSNSNYASPSASSNNILEDNMRRMSINSNSNDLLDNKNSSQYYLSSNSSNTTTSSSNKYSQNEYSSSNNSNDMRGIVGLKNLGNTV